MKKTKKRMTFLKKEKCLFCGADGGNFAIISEKRKVYCFKRKKLYDFEEITSIKCTRCGKELLS